MTMMPERILTNEISHSATVVVKNEWLMKQTNKLPVEHFATTTFKTTCRAPILPPSLGRSAQGVLRRLFLLGKAPAREHNKGSRHLKRLEH